MTHTDVPAASTPPGPRAVPVAAPRSWPWRRAALLLAGATQLITISALLGSDPIPVNWASLLLAIAPAPLAAAAAFAPPPAGQLAAAAGVLVLVAGIAGQITHTGVFFAPALIVLAVAAVRLRAEQPGPGGRQ